MHGTTVKKNDGMVIADISRWALFQHVWITTAIELSSTFRALTTVALPRIRKKKSLPWPFC